MLKIVEVKSEEHFQQLRAKEDANNDYLYICKHCNEIKLSDNGELKTIGTQNQNAFSAIAVETVENGVVEATDVTDTLVLAPGENVSIVPDNESNKVIITHQTESGNKHIPSGGSEGQLLRWKEDGTAEWATIEATSAEKDGDGNNIVETYVTKESVVSYNTARKNADLSSKGWYRIAKYECTAAAGAAGANANSCDIILKRMYSNTDNECHEVKLLSKYLKSSLVSTASTSNYQLITKIRHTVDTTNKVAYIEIYYNTSTANRLQILLNNAIDSNYYWSLMTPELTEETVDGVTVYSSMDIPANSKGTATYDNAGNDIAKTTLKADLSSHVVALTDGSYGDFNNYLDIGVYAFSTNAGMANTANCPRAVAGTLVVTDYTGASKVMTDTWAYRVQEFYTHDNSGVYKRYLQTDGSATIIFKDWVKVTDSTDLTTFNNHIANRNKPHIRHISNNTAYTRNVIGLIKLNTWDYCGGTIELYRTNGVTVNSKIEFAMQKRYNTTTTFYCDYVARGFTELSPVIFTYNGELYAGFYYFNGAAQQENVKLDIYSHTNITPFLVHVYNTNTGTVVNEEIYNSLQYNCYNSGAVSATGKWDIKAVKDGNGDNIADKFASIEARLSALENK